MTKKYGKSGRRSKEEASERGREKERESWSIEHAPISYRASVSWDITGCGPPKYGAGCADRVNIAISWESSSLAGSITPNDRPRRIVRPPRRCLHRERKAARWSLLRDRFPRVPLAPNWNWPLHPINSLCPPTSSSTLDVPRVAFVLFRVLPSRAWSLEGSDDKPGRLWIFGKKKDDNRMGVYSIELEICENRS